MKRLKIYLNTSNAKYSYVGIIKTKILILIIYYNYITSDKFIQLFTNINYTYKLKLNLNCFFIYQVLLVFFVYFFCRIFI